MTIRLAIQVDRHKPASCDTPMSALGHEQTSRHVCVMSVIPLKADIHQRGLHVRLVPIADINAAKQLA
jgi:hypothetical protein